VPALLYRDGKCVKNGKWQKANGKREFLPAVFAICHLTFAMARTALQSALVGALASAFALVARYGLRWWPGSPLEKAAYFTACPACPIDVASGRPELRTALVYVLLCGAVYAAVGVVIEAARKMRGGSSDIV
jgi:hypothetical protein